MLHPSGFYLRVVNIHSILFLLFLQAREGGPRIFMNDVDRWSWFFSCTHGWQMHWDRPLLLFRPGREYSLFWLVQIPQAATIRRRNRSAVKLSSSVSTLTFVGAPLKVCLGVWALASWGLGSPATPSEFEGKPILDIQFSAPQPLDAKDLARIQPLKKGQPLRAEDVSNAIDGLFATGRFADIIVEAEASGSGVMIRFVTQNVKFVGDVSVAGKLMDSPNRGQTFQALNLSIGAVFHEEDVTHAVESLQRLLESNGLYEAQVTPTVTPDDVNQLVSIIF